MNAVSTSQSPTQAEIDAQNYIQKLKQEQARFMASINSLKQGFLILDIKNNILIKNDAIDKMLNLKDLEGNVLLKGDMEVIEEQVKESFSLLKLIDECLAKKDRIVAADIPLKQKHLSIHVSPIISPDETSPLGVVILIEDITEAKVLERSRDEFFSIASHELRTPLTAIRGNTSMILDYFADKLTDPQLSAMIQDIHAASVRLIGIVNDFLNMSRLEQRKMEFKKDVVDIIEIIQEVIKELTHIADEKKLYLRFIPPAVRLSVLVDKDRFKEVVINLVGNGIKFTDTGGITLTVAQADSKVKVLVSDTGLGIHLSNQPLLFHKFQQAGSSLFTRDSSKGTGLGLYISKLITEGMGGTIELVKSEEGKGTTFAISLPLVST